MPKGHLTMVSFKKGGDAPGTTKNAESCLYMRVTFSDYFQLVVSCLQIDSGK